MPKISVVINCDSRPENGNAEKMFNGCVSEDYLTDGVYNKIKFFDGFDIETIVYIDEHLPIPEKTLTYLRGIVDTLVIRKHTNEPSFNCYNYLRALSLASGDIICHFDQDTACFTASHEPIHELIKHLEDHSFVSYPSWWSPKPVHDESFGKRTWASTRFFICKRETIRIDELRSIIAEPEIGYAKYGDSPRRCNWLEHFLTLTNNDSCYYPEIEPNKYLIFSWGSYERYTLMRLNELPYNNVKDWVYSKGGIQYPVDVRCD